MIRTFSVIIYDNHIEEVAVFVLHFPRFLYDIFELLLLQHTTQIFANKISQFQIKQIVHWCATGDSAWPYVVYL